MATKSAVLHGPKDLIKIPVDREIAGAAKAKAIVEFMIWSFLGLWVGTEIVAWQFGFSPLLSDQLITPMIYNPNALVWPWGKLLTSNYESTAIANHIYMVMGEGYAVLLAGMIFGFIKARKKYAHHMMNAPRTHDYEGSAHWATPLEVGGTGLLPPDHWAARTGLKKAMKVRKKAGRLTSDEKQTMQTQVKTQADAWRRKPGVYVGEYEDPKTNKRVWLRDTSDMHVGIYAPTRGGKGVSTIIPACLTWSQSLVVNDPKNELYEITSWFRKHKMGQNVFKFDPVCTDGTAARINVLDFVRLRTEYEVSDAQNIAKMIADPQGLGLDTGSESDHWRKTAYAFLTGAILHVLYSREIPNKTLTGIDAFLSNPLKSQVKVFNEMLVYEHDPNLERSWLDLEFKQTKTCPTVAMAARDMLDRPEGERASVMSSVKTYFDLYRDPIVARNIATSDFSFEDLMYGDKAATLYLVSNPNNMERLRPLMRLIVNIIVTTFTGPMDFDDGRPRPKYKHKMLLLMDEFTSTLSKMSIFANAISFVAGYGIKIIIVVQDLVQLADTYGDKGAQALTSNLHTQVVFATNNADTAKQFSQMLGNQTLRQETRSWNQGKKSKSESFRGRSLMDASEIQQMPKTDEIVMVTNNAPIYCKKIIYYEEPAFMSRVKKSIDRSDIIARENQAFYKTLVEYQEESQAVAEERRTKAKETAKAKVSVSKKVTKKFADLMDMADEDSNENTEGLKGVL